MFQVDLYYPNGDLGNSRTFSSYENYIGYIEWCKQCFDSPDLGYVLGYKIYNNNKVLIDKAGVRRYDSRYY